MPPFLGTWIRESLCRRRPIFAWIKETRYFCNMFLDLCSYYCSYTRTRRSNYSIPRSCWSLGGFLLKNSCYLSIIDIPTSAKVSRRDGRKNTSTYFLSTEALLTKSCHQENHIYTLCPRPCIITTELTFTGICRLSSYRSFVQMSTSLQRIKLVTLDPRIISS